MIDSRPPEAAVEAGEQVIRERAVVDPYAAGFALSTFSEALTAALPHLHRAFLEGLIAKAEANVSKFPSDRRWKIHTELLRAELAEEGN